MSLRELERWIAWEMVGIDHRRVHAALNRSPIVVWREHDDAVNLRSANLQRNVLRWSEARET